MASLIADRARSLFTDKAYVGAGKSRSSAHHIRNANFLLGETTVNKMQSLSEFEEVAKKDLDSRVWRYFSTGAGRCQTLKDNESAFLRQVYTYTHN